MGLIEVYTLVTSSYKVKRRLLFEENTLWRNFCIGSGNVFIGTTDSVNTSVSLASFMRFARGTEAWIEREVALCFLERKIRMSD
ncbi:hypothetical protein [Butyrivibrio sp.]|uniref:hypothetical protein n=1 Tax=Butyrivibrio sp. TaxID=28121 RepID=UPI0025C4B7D0|nr:hypothetical protein [Butyrivibrio sp.]MBQ9302451.1 hypothetical protein [Butyrivibrio sp.]